MNEESTTPWQQHKNTKYAGKLKLHNLQLFVEYIEKWFPILNVRVDKKNRKWLIAVQVGNEPLEIVLEPVELSQAAEAIDIISDEINKCLERQKNK